MIICAKTVYFDLFGGFNAFRCKRISFYSLSTMYILLGVVECRECVKADSFFRILVVC